MYYNVLIVSSAVGFSLNWIDGIKRDPFNILHFVHVHTSSVSPTADAQIPVFVFDVAIGYRNSLKGPWSMLANGTVIRHLKCPVQERKVGPLYTM